jgi:hypothetical protein
MQVTGLATVAGGRVLRNADHAFDAAHDAPDNATYDATNHAGDRAGGAVTHGVSLLAATDDALGLRNDGRRESSGDDDSHCKLHFHEQSPPLEIRFHKGILVPSLWLEREANAAINQQTRSQRHTVVTALLDGGCGVFICDQEICQNERKR